MISHNNTEKKAGSETDSFHSKVSLSGGWRGLAVEAADFQALEKQIAGETLSEEFHIPFLTARSGVNACKLERDFLFDPPAGQRVFLKIGAAMMHLKVYCNGIEAGSHFGGYTPCQIEITAYLAEGLNQLTILLLGEQSAMVDGGLLAPVSISSATLAGKALEKWKDQTGIDTPPCRFGIWQDISLEVRSRAYLSNLKVTPNLNAGCIDVQAVVCGGGAVEWDALVDGTEICVSGKTGDDGILKGRLNAAGLKMWSPDEPNLYHLTVRLKNDGAVIEEKQVRFGYRQFEIRGGDFYLNGSPVQLRGESNLLQNRGLQFTNALSLETPQFWSKEACKTYFQTLKNSLDINAIRVHGSIGHPAIFEAADEVGLLVESQSSIWSRGYGGYIENFDRFLETAWQELSEWIRRDWNHPCIVMWGAENEMMRIARTPVDAQRFQPLENIIRDLDDSRPVCFDGSSGSIGKEAGLYHFHHEENYTPFLQTWKKDKPLVFGEFWIGSRGAEQRLTSGEEYFSGEDYRRKKYELWRRRIEPMRLQGASGIFPYNFSCEWIREWDGFDSEYSRSDAGTPPDGLCVDGRSAKPDSQPLVCEETARRWRHLLGRFCVCFIDEQRTFSVEDDNTVKLPAAVRNDDGQPCTGTVELCTPDGVLLAKTKICAAPFSTEYVELDLKPGERPSSSVILCLRNSEGVLLDRVADQLYFTKPMPDSALSGIGTVHVLSSEKTVSYCDWFSAQDVELTVHTEKTLVQVDLSDGILILDSSGLAVLGEIIEQGGGRPAALFMVEISTNGPVLPGVNALNFCEPLNTAWKFEPLTGRRLTLAEMLLPAEGMWEADHHVIRSGLDNPRWHSFRFGEPVAHAVILHSGADVSDVMKTVHGVGAGLDSDGENAETFVSAEEDPQNTTHIGSLMTASRREYSVLAETFWNGIPCLLSTLKLGQNLKDDLRAGRLLANALCCLSGSAVPVRPDGFDTVKVFQCLEKCAETIHPALERIRTPEEANYIAIDSRTVFSSTKSKSLLSAKLPEFLLVPAPELVLQGGWKALSVNSCFEVSGPLFPWEFQSRYPMEHGFSGLAFIEDRVLKVYLVEKLTDPDAPPHLRHLFHQLNLYRQAGLDVDVF